MGMKAVTAILAMMLVAGAADFARVLLFATHATCGKSV
jgi:hypothetical protein